MPRPLIVCARTVMAAVLISVFIWFVLRSYRWPLLGDAQIFHYNYFLMQHGLYLYRDIPDLNMPGTYVVESLAQSVFGGSDLGWRIYDFTLLGTLTVAMIVIARPYDWMAGLFAGVLFTLQHACNAGSWNAGERDEVIAVLMMVGMAFLFEGIRQHKARLLLGFGMSLCLAGFLKPTIGPLGVLLLAMADFTISRRNERWTAYVGWSVLGGAIVGSAVLGLLLQNHAIIAFIRCFRTYAPFYAAMDRPSYAWMLRRALPFGAWILLPFAFLATLRKPNLETWSIVACAVASAVSYFAQGKSFSYQMYPLAACVFLAAMIEICSAAKGGGLMRAAGVTGLIAATLLLIPYCSRVSKIALGNSLSVGLEADLVRMGDLNHQIQCLDIDFGCYAALYHLQIVQSTPYVGDLVLFARQRSAVADKLRDIFWDSITTNPPKVIVVTNQWLDGPSSFENLKTWPRLNNYLETAYYLDTEKKFNLWGTAYRIYVRKDGIRVTSSSRATVSELR